MSRFLILSEDGDGLGLALRLKEEGHQTRLWIRHDSPKNIGQGLVDTSNEYTFGQTIIADCTGFGSLLDVYRDCGVDTFSGSALAEKLEEDRKYSEELMQEVGIETPLSTEANSWEEAKKLVEKISSKSDDGKVVIKPEGRLSGVVPSYVAKDTQDAVVMLESFEGLSGDSEPQLTIQQFIKGVALSTEGWFDGEEWIPGFFNHTLERKQTLNDDLGPSIGCTGNVVWKCESSDEVVKETLTKLTVFLRKHRYVGPLDINCVVNKKGIYGLEFTPRFGYDAFPTLLYTLCPFDFGSFVARCVAGQKLDSFDLSEDFGVGIRIRPQKREDNEVEAFRGLEEKDLKYFYPFALQQCGKEELKTCGGDRDPGVVVHSGSSIESAFAKAYKVVEKIQLKDMQYRTDFVKVFTEDFKKLEELEN